MSGSLIWKQRLGQQPIKLAKNRLMSHEINGDYCKQEKVTESTMTV